jgi:hypothetical protein
VDPGVKEPPVKPPVPWELPEDETFRAVTMKDTSVTSVVACVQQATYIASMAHMRPLLMGAALLGTSIVIAASLGEMVLRVATPYPLTAWSNQVPDGTLLYRVDPGLPDVDWRGVRNAAALDRADIVAIGDSHTYGYNVESEDAWPAQLSRMTGKSAYNFGIPSYGIYQYAALIEEAVELRPSHVIVALFPANDLQGPVGCVVLAQEAWQKRIELLDLEVPQACAPSTEPTQEAGFSVSRLYDWFAVNTALVNIVDRAITNPEVVAVGPTVVTRALLADHTAATDLETELNATHIRNAARIFGHIDATARAHGARLSVLFVPSKERVLTADTNGTDSAVERAVAAEADLFGRLGAMLDSLGIPHADATPQMAKVAGAESYPPFDGHPFADGYRAYAETARSLIH